MKIKKYLCSLIILASTVATSLNAGNANSLVQGGRLVIFSQEEPKLLDPFFNNSDSAKSVYNHIFSGLVKPDDNFDFFPDLAVSVPTLSNKGVIKNDEGMIVTYKLKDLIFWHDGAPVTSEDVRFTWQIYTNPEIQELQGDYLEGYKKIDKIETPDPKTVKIFFKEFYPEYKNLFEYVLPKHGFEPKRLLSINSSHPFSYKPVGSGPFMFVEWKQGNKLVLDANPKYFRNRPYLDQIVYNYGKFGKDTAMDFEKGKIHLIQDNTENITASVKNTSKYIVTDLDMEEMVFNMQSPVLKDINIRKALAHAINRDKTAESFTNIQSAWSDTHPDSAIYNPGLKYTYDFDIKKSRDLLDASGWKVDNNDNMRKNSDNQPLNLKLVTTDSKIHRATVEYLQEVMASLGISLEVKIVTEDDWESSVRFPDLYDLAIYTRKIAINGYDRIDFLSKRSLPPKGHNYSRFNDPAVEDIFNDLKNVNNVDKQKEISNIIQRELPLLPLFSYVRKIAVSKKLNNFRPNPLSGNTWNSMEWWLN